MTALLMVWTRWFSIPMLMHLTSQVTVLWGVRRFAVNSWWGLIVIGVNISWVGKMQKNKDWQSGTRSAFCSFQVLRVRTHTDTHSYTLALSLSRIPYSNDALSHSPAYTQRCTHLCLPRGCALNCIISKLVFWVMPATSVSQELSAAAVRRATQMCIKYNKISFKFTSLTILILYLCLWSNHVLLIPWKRQTTCSTRCNKAFIIWNTQKMAKVRQQVALVPRVEQL